VSYIVATGDNRFNVTFADKWITAITCHATGVSSLFPFVHIAMLDLEAAIQHTPLLAVELGEVFSVDDSVAHRGSLPFIGSPSITGVAPNCHI